jgi:hypothetical protein
MSEVRQSGGSLGFWLLIPGYWFLVTGYGAGL